MKAEPDNHFDTYLLSCQESDENIVNVNIELEPGFAFRLETGKGLKNLSIN